MNWMNGNLDKVQNKYKCSCGAESVHGVYDDENNHIGEFCDTCFGVYLINQGAGHDLDISTNTYRKLAELRKKQANLIQRTAKDLAELRAKQTRLTKRALDSAPPYTAEELDIITDPRRNGALQNPPSQ